jgi:hypothetical protein
MSDSHTRHWFLEIATRFLRVIAISLASVSSLTASVDAALFSTWTPAGDWGGPDSAWVSYSLGLSTDDGSNIAAIDVTLRGTLYQQWTSLVDGDPFEPTPSSAARNFDSHLTPIASALIVNLNEDSNLDGSDPATLQPSSTIQTRSGIGTTLKGVWGIPGADQTPSLDFAYIVVPRDADLSQFQFDIDVATHNNGAFNTYGLHGCSLFSAGCNFNLASSFNSAAPTPPPAQDPPPAAPTVFDPPSEPPLVDISPQPPVVVTPVEPQVPPTIDPVLPTLPDVTAKPDSIPGDAGSDPSVIEIWNPEFIRPLLPAQWIDWSTDPPYGLEGWLSLREQYSVVDFDGTNLRDVQELFVRHSTTWAAFDGVVSVGWNNSVQYDAGSEFFAFASFNEPTAVKTTAYLASAFFSNLAGVIGSSMSDADAVPAPEPTSAGLAAIAMAAFLTTRRRN